MKSGTAKQIVRPERQLILYVSRFCRDMVVVFG